MKLLNLIILGAICSLPVRAELNETLDRHPMSLKREMATNKENIRKVTEEAKSRLLNTPSEMMEEPKGISLEGDWNIKMEGALWDDLENTNWYGMLVGSTLLFEEVTKSAYPIIGEFDDTTNELTISKRYVGRDWRGRYVFVHPYTLQNGKYVSGPIKAVYNPETGELKFNPRDYLAWIDFNDYAGTEDSYDEGAWYIVMSAQRTGDLEKEKPENWDYLGEATIIDGWLSPRFGIEQNLEENWLKAGLWQYKNKPNIYRLKNPFENLRIDNYETYTKTGYIEFDLKDPDHVVFNRVDAGWTCPKIGINKLYCYNVLGYYLTDYKMSGEEYTVSDFLLFFNPYIPFTTYKDGVVDLGAMLYAGELVYDANFGDSTYPTGGNMWIGFNMRSRIYFPDTDVTEPQIRFDGEPSVSFDIDSKTAFIDIKFDCENRPDNATVFATVVDKATGRQVARKFINAKKYDNEYSFLLEGLELYNEYNYALRVQMEGGLSEILAKTGFIDLVFSTDPKEIRAAGIDGIEAENGMPAFYTLQGAKVERPVKGEFYIKVKDGKAVKVIY